MGWLRSVSSPDMTRAGRRGYDRLSFPCTKSVLQSHSVSCHSKTTNVPKPYNGSVTSGSYQNVIFAGSCPSALPERSASA
ncbi:hypothetical protein PLANTIT3_10066 [Plantibacter sp. T3]|nr:hypothetical protein PLANTIT3_10066 [Plantibacter sp. T3]